VRTHLQATEGVRATFQGTVARFGTKPAYRGPDIPTVLLRDVRDASGQIVTEHVWMVQGKQLQALCLQEGDMVAFDARVTSYIKGYRGRREDVYKPVEVDYRLSNPTRVRKVPESEEGKAHG